MVSTYFSHSQNSFILQLYVDINTKCKSSELKFAYVWKIQICEVIDSL